MKLKVFVLIAMILVIALGCASLPNSLSNNKEVTIRFSHWFYGGNHTLTCRLSSDIPKFTEFAEMPVVVPIEERVCLLYWPHKMGEQLSATSGAWVLIVYLENNIVQPYLVEEIIPDSHSKFWAFDETGTTYSITHEQMDAVIDSLLSRIKGEEQVGI